MPGERRRPSNAKLIAFLDRYHCPTPFHAVRTRFLGSIASPLLDRSPLHTIKELWDGEFPPFDTKEEFNHFLHVLMDGLWNRLAAHQIASNPFKLTHQQVKPTRDGVHHYALVRKQEIEGFMDGLFGPREELDLPESARDGADALGEIRAMLEGAIALLEDSNQPAAPDALKGLGDNLQGLAAIVEKEMNTVVLSCTRARRQAMEEMQQTKPTVH